MIMGDDIMKKRIITLALLVSMLLTMAVSCGSGDTAAETTAAPVDTEASETAETTAPRIDPKLPEKDFEGYNFRVLGKGTTNVHWKTRDIAAEDENGEPINDAVFRRNSVIGEKYNFTIEDVAPDNYNDIPGQAGKSVLAGDNEFDMFSFNVASMSFTPDILAAEIRKRMPNFEMSYDIEPVKESIANSWPNQLDDSCAREEWGWKPQWDISSMTDDMLAAVAKKLEAEKK